MTIYGRFSGLWGRDDLWAVRLCFGKSRFLAPLGMTIYGCFSELRGGDWSGGRSGGLSVRLRRLGLGWFGLAGFVGGWEAVVEIAVDRAADGFAPAVGAEGVDVFVLRDADGLDESLEEIGDGGGGAGFDVALDDGGNEACEGGTEIVGREVVAGKEEGEVFAECFGGAGAGFFLGVIVAEMRVAATAGGAAATAISEGETA
ncbi:MAG: hypothetical protein DMG35_16390 [Acidobacteria bacterium]|nr:MAG: hypothetical protein DMG35_16390 [Acidobacteriota bacterium]